MDPPINFCFLFKACMCTHKKNLEVIVRVLYTLILKAWKEFIFYPSSDIHGNVLTNIQLSIQSGI